MVIALRAWGRAVGGGGGGGQEAPHVDGRAGGGGEEVGEVPAGVEALVGGRPPYVMHRREGGGRDAPGEGTR